MEHAPPTIRVSICLDRMYSATGTDGRGSELIVIWEERMSCKTVTSKFGCFTGTFSIINWRIYIKASYSHGMIDVLGSSSVFLGCILLNPNSPLPLPVPGTNPGGEMQVASIGILHHLPHSRHRSGPHINSASCPDITALHPSTPTPLVLSFEECSDLSLEPCWPPWPRP